MKEQHLKGLAITCHLLTLYCGANCVGDTSVPFFADELIQNHLNLSWYSPNVMNSESNLEGFVGSH